MTQAIDFSKYGETETVSMSRIQRYAATALAQSWTGIPHVTHHDEADLTVLETLRSKRKAEGAQLRLSPTACLIKAAAVTLKAHPTLNASLDAANQQFVLKKYYHIGVAIDTPAGLLVGVVRECDRKSVQDIASEVARLSSKARAKGLSLEEMSGSSFTVSSLGSIGGKAFTPIINAPEVAILGVGRSEWMPARGAEDRIEWRLKVPLSLSYDHRVVNGADAARFLRALDRTLAKPEVL
jgi:pyruvate dehydrogenase E2 component (dihydrolipoamide acetyltransferase)